MEQIIKIALAVIFGLAVIGKITGKTKATFLKSGWGLGVMYATALAEALLTVGLFTQYDQLAAIGLTAIIAGAILTLYHQHETPRKYGLALLSFILLVLLITIK